MARPRRPKREPGAPRVHSVAVIDIGTTSIRMAIADIDDGGGVRTLESFSQEVNLGKDTFTTGAISRQTTEDCVAVLKKYRQALNEYGINQPEHVRVVATSAVREARNRLAFIDRIYIATGLDVEPLDEAEVNRITYMGVQPQLQADPPLNASRSVILEVGGGSTELLVVRNGNVLSAQTFRLGSLRLRETLRTAVRKQRRIMESRIQRHVEQMRQSLPEGHVELIAMGGDVRFAAAQLLPDWNPKFLARIPVSSLEELTDQLLDSSPDELVGRYHLSFPDAETIGPALLIYVALAHAFSLVNVIVTNTNLRDGLLKELAICDAWTDEFRNQIIRSAVNLGRKFAFDEGHARHVAELCRQLFVQLTDLHGLDARGEVLLTIAALLHEIGLFIGTRGHHKHAMYLIRNSEIFGMGKRDLNLVALVARYHRRATPQATHENFVGLDREQRTLVAKLAAILRLAIALDESRRQRIHAVECKLRRKRLDVVVAGTEDFSLEKLALEQASEMFTEVFGVPVLLKNRTR